MGCGNQSYGTHRVDAHSTITTTHVFDIEKGIKFPSDFFDEVYERNLLEHLRNVGLHLQEVYRVLKPKGKLTLITDYAGCKRYYTLGTHEGRYEKKHKNNPGDKHYSVFSKQHVRNHLLAVGFTKMWIDFIDTDQPTKVLDKLMRVKPRIVAVTIK